MTEVVRILRSAPWISDSKTSARSSPAADVSTARGCADVTERFPELDVLVNDMGIFEPNPFEAISR